MDVLIIFDVYGWAFNFAGLGIQKYSKHNCTIKRWSDVTESDVSDNDVAFFFNRSCFSAMPKPLRIVFTDSELKLCLGIRGETTTQYRIFPGWNTGCVSRRIYDRLKAHHIDGVFLTHNGVDTSIFRHLERPQDRFNIGWVGDSSKVVKRCYLLERLDYPVVRKQDVGKEFLVKGRDHKEMVDFYRSIDVFVFTSMHEGMPQPVLEAAATGLPIVSTAVGGVPEFLEKKWLVPCNPDNVVVREINLKLKVLRSNPNLRSRIGKLNSDKINREWSWEKIAPEYDRMFEG